MFVCSLLTGSWVTIKTRDQKKKGKVKFLLVVQNKFIMSAMGLGQCLKYGEYKTKTKTKINKGKDQRQKKKNKSYNIENCHISQI